MQQDIDYYEGRAETELEMALKATDPAAAKAHYHLAAMYLDLVHGMDWRRYADGPAIGMLNPAGALPQSAATAFRRRRAGPA